MNNKQLQEEAKKPPKMRHYKKTSSENLPATLKYTISIYIIDSVIC